MVLLSFGARCASCTRSGSLLHAVPNQSPASGTPGTPSCSVARLAVVAVAAAGLAQLAQLASREAGEPYVIHLTYNSASRTTNDRIPIPSPSPPTGPAIRRGCFAIETRPYENKSPLAQVARWFT
jgi:hypothetical protein